MTIIGVLITSYASANGARYAGTLSFWDMQTADRLIPNAGIFIFSCGAAGNMSALLAYVGAFFAGYATAELTEGNRMLTILLDRARRAWELPSLSDADFHQAFRV